MGLTIFVIEVEPHFLELVTQLDEHQHSTCCSQHEHLTMHRYAGDSQSQRTCSTFASWMYSLQTPEGESKVDGFSLLCIH